MRVLGNSFDLLGTPTSFRDTGIPYSVLTMGQSADGTISARLQASSGEFHFVEINQAPDDGGNIKLAGRCSCKNGSSCGYVDPTIREAEKRGAQFARFSAPKFVQRGPQPKLILDAIEVSREGMVHAEVSAVARLSFLYGDRDIEIAVNDPKQTIIRIKDEYRIVIERDLAYEMATKKALANVGFSQAAATTVKRSLAPTECFVLPNEDAWAEFVTNTVPMLLRSGWAIEVGPGFPFAILKPDESIEIEIREGTRLNWFEMQLGIEVIGGRIDLTVPLLQFIQTVNWSDFLQNTASATDVLRVRLADGRHLDLPRSFALPYLKCLLLLTLGREPTASELPTLSKLDAATIAAIENEAPETKWTGGEEFRNLGARLLKNLADPEISLPASFDGSLRPYQIQGVAWMRRLMEAGIGGLLADDMGLGKTVQALALISIEKAAGRLTSPALVVSKAASKLSWIKDAAIFVPTLKIVDFHGSRRDEAALGSADIVLTTYGLLSEDRGILTDRDWSIVFLDEAQEIKNPTTAAARAAFKLKAPARFALTGTPLENNLGDVWSIFNFVEPGLLGDKNGFTERWRAPIEKDGSADVASRLASNIRPFFLRRTKEEVERELPSKTIIKELIELDPEQRAVYETARASAFAEIQEALKDKKLNTRFNVLSALTKMRQICCDPSLLPNFEGATIGSSKLNHLVEKVEQLVAEGRKTLVFSSFAEMIKLINKDLRLRNIVTSVLIGGTNNIKRAVEDFEEGPAKVFLISLKAGNAGLTLTAADTVIVFDPWWTSAAEAQAIDRAHRIGQTKPVTVYKLLAKDTIEEKIEILKRRKSDLSSSLFGKDAGRLGLLTDEDFQFLLD